MELNWDTLGEETQNELKRHRLIAKHNLYKGGFLKVNNVDRLIDLISEDYFIYLRFIKGKIDPMDILK